MSFVKNRLHTSKFQLFKQLCISDQEIQYPGLVLGFTETRRTIFNSHNFWVSKMSVWFSPIGLHELMRYPYSVRLWHCLCRWERASMVNWSVPHKPCLRELHFCAGEWRGRRWKQATQGQEGDRFIFFIQTSNATLAFLISLVPIICNYRNSVSFWSLQYAYCSLSMRNEL